MVDGDGRSFEDRLSGGDPLGGPGDALGGPGDALGGPRDALDGHADPGGYEAGAHSSGAPDSGDHGSGDHGSGEHHDPTVSTALDRPASSLPDVVTTPPSAQHFQDLIALRREAEESAAAALSERREATSQASRIIEEAMRAAEMLQSEAQQALEQHRTAAEAEAAAILERARAEAAEIVQAGAHDVLEAQRLRREAAAERDRVNSELDRLRRTAQEELFSEANRHAARMDEIRTRVLHGVEAATVGVRDTVWESTPRPSGRFGDNVASNVASPTAASYLSPTPEPIAGPSALDVPSSAAASPEAPATHAAVAPDDQWTRPESTDAPTGTAPEPAAPEPASEESSFPWDADEPWGEPVEERAAGGSGAPDPFVSPPPPGSAAAPPAYPTSYEPSPVVPPPSSPQGDHTDGASQGDRGDQSPTTAPVQPPDRQWGRSEPRRRGWRSRRS